MEQERELPPADGSSLSYFVTPLLSYPVHSVSSFSRSWIPTSPSQLRSPTQTGVYVGLPSKWSRGESNPRAGSTGACDSRGPRASGDKGGAESGAVEADTAPTDLDLAKVIEAWPTLSDPIRAGIVAMVEASRGQS